MKRGGGREPTGEACDSNPDIQHKKRPLGPAQFKINIASADQNKQLALDLLLMQ